MSKQRGETSNAERETGNMREIEMKHARLNEWLHGERLDGVLIGAQHNFAWLTAGGRNGIDQSRDLGAGNLLIARDGRRWVLANSIEMARLQTEELAGQQYESIEFGWAEGNADAGLLARRARELCGSNIGSDLGLQDTLSIEGRLAPLRFSLTDEEVQRLRSLGREAGELLGEVCRKLTPGIRENQVVRLVADAMLARDLWPVVLLVAGDDRIAAYRHPVPKQQVARHTVLVATCVKRGGLIVSLSRLVHFGKVPDDLADRTRKTAVVNAHLWANTRPGRTGRDLYALCQRSYAEAGFAGEEMRHHQGGPTGYRTREWIAHPWNDQEVLQSQAFAWNPSITGTKVEETVIAGDDGLDVLTASPRWPSFETKLDGQVYRLPVVLALQ